MRTRTQLLMRLLYILLGFCGLLMTPGVVARKGPVVELTVFAASSLTEVFTELARRFEKHDPSVRVVLNFAGSSTLGLQIVEGAPADVFASADRFQMERVGEEGLLRGRSEVFATNELVVVAARGGAVESFESLGLPGVKIVLAGPQVPAGRYARAQLSNLAATAVGAAGEAGSIAELVAAILANVVSEEPNVRLVAAKVALGEADAGIVYATDALVFPDLESFALPGSPALLPEYQIATLKDAAEPAVAADFVTFVLSAAGREALRSSGFGTP